MLRVAVGVAVVSLVLAAGAQPSVPRWRLVVAVADHRGLDIVDAGGRHALTRATGVAVFDSEPRWSPSGDNVAFVRSSERGRGSGLYVVAAGGPARRLAAGEVTPPEWSPDGQRIAFSRSDGLFVVDVRGGLPRPGGSQRGPGS